MKIKATRDELQATVLGQDGALRKLPTLKKLDKLIERKKINVEAYRTRTNNHCLLFDCFSLNRILRFIS